MTRLGGRLRVPPRSRWRDEHGQVLAIVAVSLVALLGMAALAIDLGMLYVARSEAQRAADAGALAGAAALIANPGDRTRAQRIASETASHNRVRGQRALLQTGDLAVTDTSVDVWVRRVRDRGNAVPTMFGGILGSRLVDVVAHAQARVFSAGAATCLKPFIVPDLWQDANGNRTYDQGELYDPNVTGYGTAFRTDRVRDLGRPITLTPGTANAALVPSWYFLMRMPGNQGGSDIRTTIASTTCNQTMFSAGELREVDSETGLKKGPVRQGVNDLLAMDPNAYWDGTSGSVRGSIHGEDGWRASPRVINIALFDPREPVAPGSRPIRITNFATVFLERTSGDDIVGRFLPTIGTSTGSDCRVSGQCAPFAKFARLTG